jgi:hypothetical protein
LRIHVLADAVNLVFEYPKRASASFSSARYAHHWSLQPSQGISRFQPNRIGNAGNTKTETKVNRVHREQALATVDEHPAPPRETQQAIENKFIEKATRAGAINAHILKKNGHWTYVAEFAATGKAALFAAGLTNATGAGLKVDIKPTSNDAEN